MAGIIFDNVDLRSTYNFIVQDIGGRGSPPVVSQDLDMPGLDGALLLNRKVGTRKLTIRAIVYGKTSAEAKAKKDSLIRLLSTAYDQDKKILFPDTERYLWVRLGSEPVSVGPMGAVFNSIAYDLSINFEAREPYFFGEEFGDDGLIVGGIQNVSVDAMSFVGSPKTRYLPNEPYLAVQQIATRNLLGSYGSFEIDNSGNGLAEGWNSSRLNTFSLDSDSIIGDKSQKFYGNSGEYTGALYIPGFWSEGNVYFFSAYLKCSPDAYMYLYGNGRNSDLKTCENWERFFMKINATTISNSNLICYLAKTGGMDGTQWGMVDGVSVINLSKIPPMPLWMQSYFGIQKWENMSVDDLAQIFNYHKGFDIEKQLIIEINGKNLIDIEDFPASQALYSTNSGDYWTEGTGKWYDNGVEGQSGDGKRIWSQKIILKPYTTYTLSAFQVILPSTYSRGHYAVYVRDAYTNNVINTSGNSQQYVNGECIWTFNTGTSNEIFIYLDFYNSHSHLRNFQLEEGNIASNYAVRKKYTLEIPSLHGYLDASDEANFKTGKITRYWSLWETHTTDASGNITIPEYKLNSIANIQRVSDAAIKDISSSSTTLNTGWPNTEIKIRYQLSEVKIESIDFNGEINLYPGQNNIIAPRNALLKIMGNRKYMEG